MRKLIISLLATALVFNMTVFSSRVLADISTTFGILSSSSVVKTGESFKVTVAGKDIQDMYAFEVSLTFDNSLLELLNITSNIQGYKIPYRIDGNKILFAVAKSGSQLPENGDATLCMLTFSGKAAGSARVTLETVKLMDEILRETDHTLKKSTEISVIEGSGVLPTPSSTHTPEPTPTPTLVTASPLTGTAQTPVAIVNIIPELVPLDTATGLARVDLGEQAEGIFSGKGVTKINVPPVPGANAYTLEIPDDSLSGTLGGGLLDFSTSIGSIIIPGNMLAGIPEAVGKDISITIGSGDRSDLPNEETIGDRPVMRLTLMLDGVQTEWNNPNGPVTVSIPYTPKKEELVDPGYITVRYIDGEGNVVSVPNGHYVLETGMVTFTTTHFSCYTVAYVHRTFADLNGTAWAKKAIEVLASKGIISGTGGNAYSPMLNISRADYLLLLVRTLGLWTEVEDNFDDVKPSCNYYNAVGIARKLGITKGAGNNRFLPGEPISRQDMIVLTEKALKIANKLNQTDKLAIIEGFADKTQIASYASRSIAALVEAGLITGSNKYIYPMAYTTRAEAAVLLYRIYNKLFCDKLL